MYIVEDCITADITPQPYKTFPWMCLTATTTVSPHVRIFCRAFTASAGSDMEQTEESLTESIKICTLIWQFFFSAHDVAECTQRLRNVQEEHASLCEMHNTKTQRQGCS